MLRGWRHAPLTIAARALRSAPQVIDFGDTLEVSTSTSPVHDALTCTAPGVPLDGSNLVLRAFDLFRRKTGLKQVQSTRCLVLHVHT